MKRFIFLLFFFCFYFVLFLSLAACNRFNLSDDDIILDLYGSQVYEKTFISEDNLQDFSVIDKIKKDDRYIVTVNVLVEDLLEEQGSKNEQNRLNHVSRVIKGVVTLDYVNDNGEWVLSHIEPSIALDVTDTEVDNLIVPPDFHLGSSDTEIIDFFESLDYSIHSTALQEPIESIKDDFMGSAYISTIHSLEIIGIEEVSPLSRVVTTSIDFDVVDPFFNEEYRYNIKGFLIYEFRYMQDLLGDWNWTFHSVNEVKDDLLKVTEL